jgi:ATP-binding cassette subfamily B (MDR/TAP) protein 1
MGEGQIIEEGTHNSLLEGGGPYAALVKNQMLQKEAAEHAAADVDVDDDDSSDDDDADKVLRRHVTGRSVASQVLEKRRADRDAIDQTYGKAGFFKLFVRLLRLNSEHWRWYLAGTIGSVCSGMVYPVISILFGKAIADFELPRDRISPAMNRSG